MLRPPTLHIPVLKILLEQGLLESFLSDIKIGNFSIVVHRVGVLYESRLCENKYRYFPETRQYKTSDFKGSQRKKFLTERNKVIRRSESNHSKYTLHVVEE